MISYVIEIEKISKRKMLNKKKRNPLKMLKKADKINEKWKENTKPIWRSF